MRYPPRRVHLSPAGRKIRRAGRAALLKLMDERMGHADPAITVRVYAHIIRAAEIAAADVFARVMSEAA